MQKIRSGWDKYFLDLLPHIAERSTCVRHKFGAIVTRDNHILTTGYNGAVSGAKHCTDQSEFCWRNSLGIESGTRHEICQAVHAEQNAIAQAAKLGIPLNGGTIYISDIPCIICSKLIVNSGIKKVIIANTTYPDTNGLKIIHRLNLPILYVTFPEQKLPEVNIFAICPDCGNGHFIGPYHSIVCPNCKEVRYGQNHA